MSHETINLDVSELHILLAHHKSLNKKLKDDYVKWMEIHRSQNEIWIACKSELLAEIEELKQTISRHFQFRLEIKELKKENLKIKKEFGDFKLRFAVAAGDDDEFNMD